MFKPLEHECHRFASFAASVLAPAIYSDAAPLRVSAQICTDPIPYDEAVRREFRPVETGWRFGPVWSTAWLRVQGRVPESPRGRPIVLRFDSGTEATLWQDGVPIAGFDANHREHLLAAARAGDEFGGYVEAACNRPLGATFFWWDSPELRSRWAAPLPGRLDLCELAVRDDAVWRLHSTYEFIRQYALLHDESSGAARALLDALRDATARIDPADVGATAGEAMDVLSQAMQRGDASSASACIAVGHAHIDTAWLWRTRETRRKCIRSFASALRLMEQNPGFRFTCSQAQQYAWLERDCPALFAQIAQRVREGRWEAGGAAWVEPDCNVPSGESLVRQILHGVAYWREKFGDAAPQDYLFLPDTFGFPACLPQIMRLAGLRTFVTNKLCWNDTTEFPHVSFVWRGLDGGEVLAHCTPGGDYNSDNSPRLWQRGERHVARMDQSRAGLWLQPYGYGDGGGGPTAQTALYAELAAKLDGLPRVRGGTIREFCRELWRRREAERAAGRDFPAWDGELYLQYHRGTYTTQAWLKRANRLAEERLRSAELLTWFGPRRAAHEPSARAELDAAWKTVLLNQFHDILPGSSIAEVYEDARREHDEVARTLDARIDTGLRAWANALGGGEARQSLLVFNPSSAPATAVVEHAGRELYVEDVPALGVRVIDAAVAESAPPAAVVVSGRSLRNALVAAEFDNAGRVARLWHVPSGRQAAAGPLNALTLYEDRPRFWDAWDIDLEHEDSAAPVETPCERFEIVRSGPLRGAIEIERPLGRASRIRQRYVLDAGSPRLDVLTWVDWREEHRLLRALFPVAVRSPRATYGTQFGFVERPTHRNTPADRAMFEVCAHRWMNLSAPGLGVALLNDGKYGHSCRGHVMGLTLLRAPRFPDASADVGEHEFTYSLMPHAGDWRAAGVSCEAERLNRPLIVRAMDGAFARECREWAPMEVEAADGLGGAGVEVVAAKPADDGNGRIVRLVETHGAQRQMRLHWRAGAARVEAVDLLERPLSCEIGEVDGIRHDAASGVTSFVLRPFQIVTLRGE